MSARHKKPVFPHGIVKSPTGIAGLDQIAEGGLPAGRPTLICGNPGCGKTVLAMEFLIRGATRFNEPGVFVAFEETEKELSENFASMGFDLPALLRQKKIAIDHIHIDRGEVQEIGEYDLEALFIRLESAMRAVGAKRIVLDTIEALFSGFSDTNILRAELRRLFLWLKDRGITAIITAESGDGRLTRQGIEEYVADCVILLDHRVENQCSIRRMRIVKYRGTPHGTNEYPFLIGEGGFSVLPVTALRLDHKASMLRISSGIPQLDAMLTGGGFYQANSILVSGSSGTGKSSLAAHFVQAACQRGESALYFATEQSSEEMIRNMRSIGVDLERWMKRGLLRIHSCRPGTFGLERHLVKIHEMTTAFDPKVVVIDPMTNFQSVGSLSEVKSMVTRLIDSFKSSGITAMFISLTEGDSGMETSEVDVSSQMDAWLALRNLESNGERNRGLYVLKARGMAHSNQIREFVLTDHGVELVEVYVGPGGMLTGSARIAQNARERDETERRREELHRKNAELKNKRQQMEAEIERLRVAFKVEEQEILGNLHSMQLRDKRIDLNRVEMGRARSGGNTMAAAGNGRARLPANPA
jgi:circadian clock protein KaiC